MSPVESSTTKPEGHPSWVSLDQEEITEEVAKLARTGASAAQIGALMRDVHAVPRVKHFAGKKMKEILREQNLSPQIPEDLSSLLKRVIHMQQHLAKHPSDLANKRGLALIEARIRRLSKYYKQRKLLDPDWHYSAETAALQVE